MRWRGLAIWCWVGAGAAAALMLLNAQRRPWMAVIFVACCWWLTDLGRSAWRAGRRRGRR